MSAKQIKVVIVEPGKPAYEATVKNELDELQRIVGGNIDIMYTHNGTMYVINDEGKINGMEGNRHIDSDVIAGTFFVTADNGRGDFRSLTKKETEFYLTRFAKPEIVTREEIEQHTGFSFVSW